MSSLSQPVYSMPVVNNKVKILVNGEKISSSTSNSKHAKYINFIGDIVPEIIENNKTDSYDINLEEFVNKIIDKKMEKRQKKIQEDIKKVVDRAVEIHKEKERLNRTLAKKNAD